MKIHTIPPTPKKTESTPIEHLEGLPPYLMMKIVERLKERLKEYAKPGEVGYCWITGLPRLTAERPYTDEERAEIARDILRRMMAQRMRDGKQFDSVLAASKRYFAKNLLPQLLKEMESAK